jgi:hypothetical protein
LEDREARAKREAPAATATCFRCSKSFAYRGPRGDNSGRFCSDACRIEYDTPRAFTFDPFKMTRWRVIAGGNPGFLVATPMTPKPGGWRVACRGCGKRFESHGWAYCSRDCKSVSAERMANRAAMADVGMDLPAKRRCQCPGCDNTIPVWRKGRRVSKTARFCSDKCSAKARQKTRMASGGSEAVLSPETAKKCPENGASTRGDTMTDIWEHPNDN